jgi:hypothetical protein
MYLLNRATGCFEVARTMIGAGVRRFYCARGRPFDDTAPRFLLKAIYYSVPVSIVGRSHRGRAAGVGGLTEGAGAAPVRLATVLVRAATVTLAADKRVPPPGVRKRRLKWAELLKRVFAIDVLAYGAWGSRDASSPS